MKHWKSLGKLIADNMYLIVPLCLLMGIFFPDVFLPLKPFVVAMFAFVTFQGALANNFRNLADTFRHPLPMVVAIGISEVLMPVMGYVLGSAFFSDPDIVTGMVIEYSVPIAVTASMWVGICGGDMSLALGTVLVSTILAPFSIPLTIQLLVCATVEVDSVSMIRDMLVMIAIPALLGTLVNDASKGWGRRELSPALAPLARIFVILVITTNSTSLSEFMLNLDLELVGVMAMILAMAVLAYVLGYLAARLMRLPEDKAISLTFCSAMRNISAGAVIAQGYFAPITMFPVMTGTLFNQFLAAICGKVILGRLGRDGKGTE